jgi:hypothetical protein
VVLDKTPFMGGVGENINPLGTILITDGMYVFSRSAVHKDFLIEIL